MEKLYELEDFILLYVTVWPDLIGSKLKRCFSNASCSGYKAKTIILYAL